ETIRWPRTASPVGSRYWIFLHSPDLRPQPSAPPATVRYDATPLKDHGFLLQVPPQSPTLAAAIFPTHRFRPGNRSTPRPVPTPRLIAHASARPARPTIP